MFQRLLIPLITDGPAQNMSVTNGDGIVDQGQPNGGLNPYLIYDPNPPYLLQNQDNYPHENPLTFSYGTGVPFNPGVLDVFNP